jgi:cytochrome c553
MIKKIILSTALIILISGCGDSKKTEEENKDLAKVEKIETPLKIEVEENKNAREIKIVEKEKTDTKGESYYYDYNVKSEYDPNSKPANEDASVREKPRTIVDANLQVRSPYEKVKISLLVKSLSKEFIVKCSACHNDYANGIIGPSLLNKDSSFIFNQIKKFKEDKDANVLMTDLVKQMSDENIKKLADEISEFNTQIKEMK